MAVKPVNGKDTIPVGIAAGVQLVLIIIQLTSFVLYLPIYIAKKIALLVFTNLIFFTFPVVFGIIGHKRTSA